MDKGSLESTLRTLDIWLIVFGIFIAVSVVGESIVGFLHWRRGGELAVIQTAEKLELTNSIAAANARASDANKKAETERLERVKLEAKVSPRRLSGEQVRKMSAVLSKAIPAPLAIVSRLMDAEGKDFADDIAAALKASGWESRKYVKWTQFTKGVFIATVEKTPLGPQAAPLFAALKAANIEYKIITIDARDLETMSPHFQPKVLYLLVGAKP